MKELGFDPDTTDVPSIINKCDTKGNGGITFEDFFNLLTLGITEEDDTEEIQKAFRLFDQDETGDISFKDLQRVAHEVGDPMDENEINEILEEVDRSGKGAIGEQDFL